MKQIEKPEVKVVEIQNVDICTASVGVNTATVIVNDYSGTDPNSIW